MRLSIAILSLLVAPLALAHGGAAHSHELITEVRAKEIAKTTVGELTTQKKVDASWRDKEPKITQKKFFGKTEWVATFENPAVQDAAKKKLYVFLSLDGAVLGANHTGN